MQSWLYCRENREKYIYKEIFFFFLNEIDKYPDLLYVFLDCVDNRIIRAWIINYLKLCQAAPLGWCPRAVGRSYACLHHSPGFSPFNPHPQYHNLCLRSKTSFASCPTLGQAERGWLSSALGICLAKPSGGQQLPVLGAPSNPSRTPTGAVLAPRQSWSHLQPLSIKQ